MANRMKAYQRNAEACERRWKTASEQGNVSEMYTAVEDYDRNINAQKEELKKMDPDTKEYEKARDSIKEQESTRFQMKYEQKRQVYGEDKKHAYDVLESKNTQLSRDMDKAIERGDVSTYESLRSQYERNIAAQDSLGTEMRSEKISYYDTGRLSKTDIYDHDVRMRDKLNEKVAERESNGKTVSGEDRTAAEKYTQRVKQDEVDKIKYDGERNIQSLHERNASEEEINAQKEKNEQDQAEVRKINR